MKTTRARWIALAAVALVAILVVVVVILTRPSASPVARGVATSTPSPPPSTPAPASPTPTAAAPAIPSDALVVVTATATDVSGAKLGLRMVVHRPLGFADAAAAPALAQLTSACSTDENWNVTAEPESGIEQVDFTSTPFGSIAWPSSAEVTVWPSNSLIRVISGQGVSPSQHYANTSHPVVCQYLPAVYGPAAGSSTVLLWARAGFQQPVASPNFYRWQQNDYGFGAASGPQGPVTISDCTVTVTDAASAFGFDPAVWTTMNDAYDCKGSGVLF